MSRRSEQTEDRVEARKQATEKKASDLEELRAERTRKRLASRKSTAKG